MILQRETGYESTGGHARGPAHVGEADQPPPDTGDCEIRREGDADEPSVETPAGRSMTPRGAAFLTDVFIRDYAWLNARLRRKLGCRFNAEDIAAETFAQVAAKPAPEQVREPRALLTTIAQRLVYDLWRRRDLERAYLEALAHLPEDLHPSPEETAMALGTLAAVDRALGGLQPKARAAFIYSQFDGLTYAEIASHLNVSVSMVRQYIAKALQACYLAAS